MRPQVALAAMLFLCVFPVATGCRPDPSTKPVVVPRMALPGASGRTTLVYRKDPAAPADLLLCPLKFSSYMGQPGEDPYEDANPPAEPLLVYRYRASDRTLSEVDPQLWRSAGTPVGFLYLSAREPFGLELDHSNKVLVGQTHRSPLAGAHSGYLSGSPADPASDRIHFDSFGGMGATHAAVLTSANKDRPGMVPTTGGALRGPYFVQIFDAPAGAQVGPTRVLELGEKTLFPPEGGWTHDGQYILYYYMMSGHVWIIPTPEVGKALAAK